MLSLLLLIAMSYVVTLADETALQEFTSGNNLFTASVYKEITKNEEGNFLVSPFSAEVILALAQSGAKDDTKQELLTALHLRQNQEKIEAAVRTLKPTLKKSEPYTLQLANKIYVKDNFQINDNFAKVAKEAFGAGLENINFENKVEAASSMNDWVEKQTQNKIQNLIDPSSLTDRTRTILINALYFKGNWSKVFESYSTIAGDFYKTAKEVKKVDLMHNSAFFNYYESPELNAKFLELPFQGGDVSLTVVLPNEKEGLTALESQVDKVIFPPQSKTQYVNVALPKFKIESKLDYKNTLQKLGVTKPFKREEADFSGIAGKKGDLIINQVIQKTFLDLNEQGVEAAAATYVDVGVPLSGFFPLDPPKEFTADHPFLFYIRYKHLILFIGRVSDPSA